MGEHCGYKGITLHFAQHSGGLRKRNYYVPACEIIVGGVPPGCTCNLLPVGFEICCLLYSSTGFPSLVSWQMQHRSRLRDMMRHPCDTALPTSTLHRRLSPADGQRIRSAIHDMLLDVAMLYVNIDDTVVRQIQTAARQMILEARRSEAACPSQPSHAVNTLADGDHSRVRPNWERAAADSSSTATPMDLSDDEVQATTAKRPRS